MREGYDGGAAASAIPSPGLENSGVLVTRPTPSIIMRPSLISGALSTIPARPSGARDRDFGFRGTAEAK